LQDGFAAQKEDLTATRNRTGADRFTSKTEDVGETLKKSTYGLVQLSEFKETREKLEEQARKEAAGAAEVK
jgi:protein FAM50